MFKRLSEWWKEWRDDDMPDFGSPEFDHVEVFAPGIVIVDPVKLLAKPNVQKQIAAMRKLGIGKKTVKLNL